MDTKLELISHKLCPYVQRAAITLLEKSVPFDRIDIDLSNKPDWFKAISPLGKTPVLRVGGRDVIFESAVICEYLDETEAPQLHPVDPLARARHRSWIEFASATLTDIGALYTAAGEASFEQARHKLKTKATQIEAVLDQGPFFAGPAFSLVDAAFAPVFRYFDIFDKHRDLAVFDGQPKTSAWRQALSVRPSVRMAVDDSYAERLTAFLVAKRSHLSGAIEAVAPRL